MRRFLNHPLREISIDTSGAADAFQDQWCKWFQAGPFRVGISDNDRFGPDDERWRHLSLSHRSRLPSYEELKSARYTFFPAEAEVIQVFPPESEFVNCHPYCLHLWWSKDRRLVPPTTASAVGPRAEEAP
jgi:hypothetical protein